jgi:DNA-binding GntR family transcriptional regulator
MNPIPISNQQSLLLHKPIVAALEKRDGEAAARASRHQMEEALRRLRKDHPTSNPIRGMRKIK